MFNDIEEMKRNGDVEGLFDFLQRNHDKSDKGWMARLDAAEMLAQLGDPRGSEYLQRMAKSPNKDIREIASEILDGLKDYQPEPIPSEPIPQIQDPAPIQADSLFFKINSKYPYEVAWGAFVTLYLIVVTILNSLAAGFLAILQTWLPGWISPLIFYLPLLVFGFLVFRFVIRIFVLPYENKS